MRATNLLPVLLLALLPVSAHPNPPDANPGAQTEYNEANWAELDAQARITEGDYDGAVQAEQHAEAARKAADELAARARP